MTAYHLIGIGGAGMSVVAELLAARGARVSGSDKVDSPVLERLRRLGIDAHAGHDASQVPEDAVVVVSSAVRESNPELAVARARGQEVIHRSQGLALAAEGMRFVAVAGAHGKTTTSGMLTVALAEAGVDPSAAVGGVVARFGSGAHLGTGDIFVAEADESDGSFLNYSPTIELVTNVEPDHLDRYGTREAFEQAFVDFADRMADGGLLVCCAEDAGAARLASRVRARGRHRVITYGRASHCASVPDVVVTSVSLSSTGGGADLSWDSPSGAVEVFLALSVPGEHNVLNAAGAWVVGCELGVPPLVMARSLAAFTGTSRRFECRGQVGSRRIIDDYAHHPTEVAAAIAQARTVADGAPVVVVFQPHLYSRTLAFADRFAQALSGADRVVLTDIYAAREDPVQGVDSSLISSKIPGAQFVPDMFEATRCAADLTGEGGILLTMGAGDITTCAPVALARWEETR